ncbi:MAG: VIT domain-containing protein [Bacteroidota bacterium]
MKSLLIRIYPHLFLVVLCSLLLLYGCKSSQNIVSPVVKTPSPPPLSPELLVVLPGEDLSQALQLEKVSMATEVVGLFAQTTLEFTFYNPHPLQLSGTFFLPLGPQQEVKGMALEIEGEFREAVPVEINKARDVYEDVVRKNIDPALVEWSRSQHFSTRIFPIPAEGRKRIRIVLDQDLMLSEELRRLVLPFPQVDSLPVLDLSVKLFGEPGGPMEVSIDSLVFAATRAKIWQARQTLRYTSFLPALELTLPSFPTHKIWVEQGAEGEHYFAAYVRPENFIKSRPLPRQISILWDVSHSANRRDNQKAFAFLDQIFQRMQHVDINLVPFHIYAEASQYFQVKAGNWASLKDHLDTLTLDGGTRFATLNLKDYPADEYWIFTDGMVNLRQETLSSDYTEGTPHVLLPETPVFALNASQTSDPRALNLLTQNGGKVIDLYNQPIENAVRAMTQRPYALVDVQFPEESIEAVRSAAFRHVNGPFMVVGKMKADESKLQLGLGVGRNISENMELALDKINNYSASGMVADAWARAEIRHLYHQPTPEPQAMLAVGQKFHRLTPSASLLVLDRIEDYVRYRVLPPEGLRAEYDALVTQEEEKKNLEWISHIDKVASEFLSRKVWWETSFAPIDSPFEPDENRKDVDEYGAAEEEMAASPATEGSFADLEVAANDEKAQEENSGTITLNAWESDAPYMDTLRKVDPVDLYDLYLELKDTYGQKPAFYIDVADFLWKEEQKEAATKILSNLGEIGLDNPQMLRVMGRRLFTWEQSDWAIAVFKQLIKLRPTEPQSFRDLALAYAQNDQLQLAVDGLYEVIRQPWGERFPEIAVVATHELNAIIAQTEEPLSLSDIDPRLIAQLPTDVRVVIDWDANDVDIDLWVIDPRGEKCYYQNKLTSIGGLISKDFTQGYGPEEFLLKRAPKGTYKVQVNYYGDRNPGPTGPATVFVRMITDYGRKSQREQQLAVRMEEESAVIDIGTFEFK